MKKLIIGGALLLSLSSYSQGVIDAYRFSQTDFLGTARSMGMGGAMGAIGNDISAIAINPAGIGTYKNVNEILGTIDIRSQSLKTEVPSNSVKTDKTYFKFDNLAFVGSFYLGDDAVPFINVGFSYNRLKNFDNEYDVRGATGSSLTQTMAAEAGDSSGNLSLSSNANDKWSYEPWLALMGANSGFITEDSSRKYAPRQGYEYTNQIELYNKQKGSINTYDLNVGTEIEKILNVGMSFSVTDLSYHLYSNYYEDYATSGSDFMELRNEDRTDGTGYQFSVGALLKPIDYLSIGVAYHSPTWYDMRRYIRSYFDYKNSTGDGYYDSFGNTGDFVYDYDLRTPDKWSFSLASTIKGNGRNIATFSADYELTNYKNAKFTGDGDRNINNNKNIKDFFRMASTIRVGAEVAISPNFLGRVGYSWQQGAVKDILVDGKVGLAPSESVSQYMFNGDANYYTWGLGYRFNNGFFADLAFVYKDQKNTLYTSTFADPIKVKTNNYQGLLTIGYRFSSFY